MLLFSPPSSFFSFPFLSTRLPGRGTLSFVSSLFIFPSLILPHSRGHKGARKRARRKSFTWAGRATGKSGLKGVREMRGEVGKGGGGGEKGSGEGQMRYEVEEGDVSSRICVVMLDAIFLWLWFWGVGWWGVCLKKPGCLV